MAPRCLDDLIQRFSMCHQPIIFSPDFRPQPLAEGDVVAIMYADLRDRPQILIFALCVYSAMFRDGLTLSRASIIVVQRICESKSASFPPLIGTGRSNHSHSFDLSLR